MKAFNGYFSLYLNKETGEIFESYEASQNTRLEGDDIVQASTPALCGAGLNNDEIATFEMWCHEWYTEWFNEFFEPTLATAKSATSNQVYFAVANILLLTQNKHK